MDFRFLPLAILFFLKWKVASAEALRFMLLLENTQTVVDGEYVDPIPDAWELEFIDEAQVLQMRYDLPYYQCSNNEDWSPHGLHHVVVAVWLIIRW